MCSMTYGVPLGSVPSFSEGYWNVCNDSFDRTIYTAADMQQRQRGNCFTLSEFLCMKLISHPAVIASGLCIEVLASRRNYHVSSWALFIHPPRSVRLDLLEEFPIPIPEMVAALTNLATTPNDALYVATTEQSSLDRVMSQQSVSEAYEWPQLDDAHEALYLNAPAGIQTLHALALAGGIRRLRVDDEAGVRILPTLPR
ncbi:MAG: hypothetical protein JWN38_164 [Candidatus Saccharibacteria bacterium]|nr:hypothetical protein [Candidatus Saccharibacteria bacterium]